MSFARINGEAVYTLRGTIPAAGVWWLLVEPAEDVELAGRVTVVVGDLELRGTVREGGPFDGAGGYLVVGGAGGWGREVQPRAYQSDSGIKLSLVASDAALDAGETLRVGYADRAVGKAYTRPLGPGSMVLADLVPRAWYVDTNGETVIGARPASEASGYVVVDYHPAHQLVILDSERPAQLLPGARITIEGQAHTIGALHIELEGDSWHIEAELNHGGYGVIAEALDAHAQASQREAGLFGVYEYRVAADEGGALGLQPTDATLGLPALPRVASRPGLPGLSASLKPNARVLVSFINGDRARPHVTAYEGPDGEGFQPLTLSIEAVTEIALSAAKVTLGDLGKRVIYEDMPVSIGNVAGPITINPIAMPPVPTQGLWT